jgi:23S rRNA pseudouridine2605 synthase
MSNPMVRRMSEDQKTDKGERIAKVLARAGVASRREVERMIEDGRIRIDGKILETPATLVKSLEGITVDGEAITQVAQTKIWRMHKRRGTLTTHNDPEGRPTVFDRLPEHMGRVISVGRLDMNTEGLLLLTNDGELARWLELPANSVVRKYRVRVHGYVNEKALEKLKNGVTIEGVRYGEIDAALERQVGANAWITITIKEGKNREVRRVMEHLGLNVNRLIRTHYGPFSLGTIELNGISPVGEKQMYEVLSDFFKDAPQAMGTTKIARDPSKWAKAKKETKSKPGAKRRRQFKQNEGEGAEQPTKDGRKRLGAKTGTKVRMPDFEKGELSKRGDRKGQSPARRKPDQASKGRPPKGQARAVTPSKGPRKGGKS